MHHSLIGHEGEASRICLWQNRYQLSLTVCVTPVQNLPDKKKVI